MDEGIGRPHQLEHFDLGALVEDIQAQGVADDQQYRGEQQHGDAGDGVAQQVHDPLQPGQPLQIQLALLDPVFIAQFVEQLGRPFRVLPARIRDHAQHRRQWVAVEVVERIAKAGDLAKLLERLIPAHVGDRLHLRVEQDPLLHVEDVLLGQILAQVEGDLGTGLPAPLHHLGVFQQHVEAGGQRQADPQHRQRHQGGERIAPQLPQTGKGLAGVVNPVHHETPQRRLFVTNNGHQSSSPDEYMRPALRVRVR